MNAKKKLAVTPTEAKTWRKLLRKSLDLFSLPPPMKVSEWADEYYWTKRGKFTCFPWQREPMDDSQRQEVAEIILQWPSQVLGKTETINVVFSYHIDRDPAPILFVGPTVEVAESWGKEKFMPSVRATPVLRSKIKEARSRDSGNTIAHKQFAGGDLAIVGANSPAGLAMRDRRVLGIDEPDRYPDSAGKEGDPIALAKKRTESYPDAVIYQTGTPTVEGLSKINNAIKLSDQRHFHVLWPCCGEMQPIRWSNRQTGEKYVVWEEGKPETAMLKCPKCGKLISDEQRVAMIRDPRAHWKAHAPFTGIRGYILNGLYCLWKAQKGFQNRLHQFATEFINANAKGTQSLKAWTNTFLAETWEEKGERIDHVSLSSRCEQYPILPPGGLVIVGAADVQSDRIEYELIAYGKDEESWGVRYEVLQGNPEFEPVWDALFDRVTRSFDHPCGKKLKPAMFLIDAGHLPRRVIKFVRRCHRQGIMVYASIGSRKRWDAKLVTRPAKLKTTSTWFMLGTDHAKVIVMERLKIATPGPRYCHFPIGYGYDEEWFKQVTAEKLTLHYENDILVDREWVKQRDRNEALDIRVGILGALEILNPNYEAIAKTLEVKAENVNSKANADNKSDEQQKEPSFVQKPFNPRRFRPGGQGGGFVGRWRY